MQKEQKKVDGKGNADIYGDCNKVLPRLDLNVYDIIDLDCYGLNSLVLLEKIAAKGYEGIVILTVIQSGYGKTNKSILKKIGYSDEQISKCNTLISRNFENILKKYIQTFGIQEIKGYFCGRKMYFYVKLKKPQK